MKILIINKFLYKNGGSETYIFKLGEELIRQGHSVEYFGMEHPDNCVSNSIGAYTEQMDFHGAGALKQLKLSLKTIYSVEARQKIRLVLDDFCPDVVHLNNFNYQLTPSIIVEIRKWEKEAGKRVKIVFTAHDSQLVCPNHMLKNPNTNEICQRCLVNRTYIDCLKGKCVHGSTMKSLIGTIEAVYWNKRKIYSEIDTIICCSEYMKSQLDTNPILKEKTIALHNFIDEGKKSSDVKDNYILYFGRFSEEKGVATLIEVCKELKDISFIFAGKGPLEDEVNSVSNIKNVGFKTDEELDELISHALASLCPSEWIENCPLSVIESISLGTPVIGASIGGVPELIDDEKTGILFEAFNKDALKASIVKLWNNRELAEKMAENCRSVDFDTLSTYTDKLIKIFSE